MELLILADDFTGAADAAAAFGASRGVLVVLSATAPRSLWEGHDVDVLAVDLDLRESAEEPAQRKTEDAARLLGSTLSQSRLFLKIDSTLRGPIAGLVEGALAGSGKDLAVLAPAFPEQGRLLLDGRVVVDGQPGASLATRLALERTTMFGLNVARSAEAVERSVEGARRRGARRVVVDADSSACLETLAAAWERHPEWLLVGSAGLARRVAGPTSPDHSASFATVSGPVLIIAGSPTPMTAAQIDRLRPFGAVVALWSATHTAPLPLPLAPTAHGLLVLCTPPTTERDTGQAASALADVALEWSKSLSPAAVVLAGGATARGVCERLGAVGVRLFGELSPGVPIGRFAGGVWDQVLVVTKAGGFGNPNTLLDAARSVGVLSI